MKVALTALLAALLCTCGVASAKPLTRHDLSKTCGVWGNQDQTAFACDPEGGKRRITVTLGSQRDSEKGVEGIASVGSGEPLAPGETVTVDWAHPSRQAELLVRVASPIGSRAIVLVPDWRPTHIEVTALAGGSAELRTAAKDVTLPPPSPQPTPPPWQARTPRQAALALVTNLDHLERSITVLRTLCGAIDPYVGAGMGIPIGIPPLDGIEQEDPCLTVMYLSVHGDENVPTVISTKHRGLSVSTHGSRAIFSTTLIHRYRTEDGKRRRLVTRARALLVKDAAGIWHLAGIESLFPLYVIDHPRPFSDRELTRIYSRDRRLGARAQARFQRNYDARVRATVQAGTSPPCTPSYVTDKPGDVVWNEGTDLARHPADHEDVDLVAAAQSGSCLGIRTTAALPDKFTVSSNVGEVTIHVSGRRVLVQDESEDVDEGKPIVGVVASLVGNELVVKVPGQLKPHTSLDLLTTVGGEFYGDSHSFR